MLIEPGQPFELDYTLVQRANGDAIDTGPVYVFIYARNGVNAGKWYVAGEDDAPGTWSGETVASGLATECFDETEGKWRATAPAELALDGADYYTYPRESNGLHIPCDLDVQCRVPTTGLGPYAITIHVTNDADPAVPIESARVRLVAAAGGEFFGVSNSAGMVDFGLAAGTYRLIVWAGSAYTFASDTITVSADATFEAEMTPNTLPAPSSPQMSVCWSVCRDQDGAALAGVTAVAKLVAMPSGDTANEFSGADQTKISDSSGLVAFNFPRGAQCAAKQGGSLAWKPFVVADADATEMPSIIGD